MRWWPFGKKKKQVQSRAFAGAMYGRLVADWVASNTSMDAEIKGSLKALRNRSRQLGRDNDYAKGIFREITNNIVGDDGFTFQAQVRKQRLSSDPTKSELNAALNDQIEWEWYRWTKKQNCHVAGVLSFADIERLAIKSIAEAGEVVIRFIYQSFGNSKIPLGLEIIEADMLDDDYNGISSSGNTIRMGVEFNEWQRPVAYYFHHKHPGDYAFPGENRQRINQHLRVPADEILHLYVMERVGQTRGVPWLASTVMRLNQMNGYEEAEVVAARVTAALMGFIETPEGELKGDDVEGDDRVTEFAPGKIAKLSPGEKFNVPAMNRPSGAFDPFMKVQLRGAASGAGLAYETVSKDYSNTSYSSARQSILAERDNYRSSQKWLRRNFHHVVYAKWLERAVLANVIKINNFFQDPELYTDAVKFMPRGWAWVDPTKDIEANKEGVLCGFTTQADVVAERGGDLEELMVQRKRELELAKKYGLKFETDAGFKAEQEAAKKPFGNGGDGGEEKPKDAEADFDEDTSDEKKSLSLSH